MNITHLVENLNRGGLERVVIDLVVEQARNGNNCQVVCLYEKGTMAHELESSGINVFACHKKNGLDMAALKILRKYLKTQDAQILHSHNAVAHYYGVFASLFLGIKTIINTRHGMGGGTITWKRELLYRIALMRTKNSVAVCKAASKEFARRKIIPLKKLKVVCNGIHAQKIESRNKEKREVFTRENKINLNDILLVTVGRLNYTKNQKNMINSFLNYLNENNNATLVIIGDGELREELEKLSSTAPKGSIIFLGDRSDVNELLPCFDIFLLSSITEGYSIALLEACAAGLAIIATDVGGNKEIVQNGVNGIIVPARSTESMSSAISLLVGDSTLRRKYGNYSRQWVLNDGAVKKMADQYYDLYSAI